MLLGLLRERRRAEDARAVDEHVDAAEALDRPRHERVRLVAARDPAGDGERPLARRVEVRLRGVEHGCAGAGEDDRRSVVEEAAGGGAADAAAPAGDENDLV